MEKCSDRFNVILVGGGIANIMCAINLVNKPGINVLLIEQGSPIENRKCPKEKAGSCVHCSPCKITAGFGGAGFCSDCKLTYSDEVGGDLANYIGKDTYKKLMNDVSETFDFFNASENYVYNEEFANSFQYECSKYGMKLLKYPVRHLGTDGARVVMQDIWEYLEASKNITILCNTKVTNIDFKNKIVYTMDAVYQGKILSIAVGRHGSEWLSNLCKEQGLAVKAGSVDIGVRIECPRSILDKITDNLYEMKIFYTSSTGNTCRTFCVNPGGYVVEEHFDDVTCVNGHSLSDNKSFTTNFSILVNCHFTEPFNQPIEYGKRICRLSNMLSDNKPMVQRLVDLQSCKRSTYSRMKRLIYEPTLKGAEPGDLRYVFPSNILTSIVEFLDKLENVMPGISSEGNNTILYSPECKFSSAQIVLNKNLQNDEFPDVYFAGDSAGISRGIMQAAIAGTYIAKHMIGEIK